MNRAKRLQPVVDHSNDLEREAARVLAQFEEAVRAQAERLKELEGYRDEYQRMLGLEQGGVRAERLIHYQAFIDRISRAIEQQRAQCEAAQRVYDEKRQAWLGFRAKRQALDKVVAQYAHEEARAAARREQYELDERAMRTAFSKDGM